MLLGAVLLMLAGAFAAITAQDRAAALDAGWVSAELAARGAAEHAERSLGVARLVTDRIAARIRREGHAAFRGAGQAELAAMLPDAPTVNSLWVMDAAGTLVAVSLEPEPPPTSFADRPYFAPLRDGARSQLSPLLLGRLSHVWFFSYNRAVRDPEGRFLGIVQASIHAEEFQRFQAGLGLGAGGHVGLYRAEDGAPLMLHPLPLVAGPAGTPQAGPAALPEALRREAAAGARREGRFERKGPDGRPLLVAWRLAEGGSVIASAALPRDQALAAFDGRLRRNAILFGLALAAVAGLGWAVAAALGRGGEARRAAEAGRRELAAVLEATGEGVLALDAGWRITFVNRRAAEAVAGGRDLRGMTLQAAFPGVEGSAFETAYRRTMESGRPAVAEAVLAGLGRRFRAESHKREDGGIVIFFRDVTEERSAAARLAESEARLRQVFSAIDEGYALCEVVQDAEGRATDYRFIEVNPEFSTMIGLGDISGLTARQAMPDLEQHWLDSYGRVALDGEPMRFENSWRGRWFDVFATPVPPRGRFVMVFREVTARREAEAALRETEARLRRAQEAGGVGLWEWDAATGAAFWSPPQRRLLGVAPEAPACFERFMELVHPDDRAALRDAFLAALKTSGAAFEAEFRIRRADTGEERWLAARGEAERDGTGRAWRMVGVNMDITARRMAEAALAESEARLRLAQEAADVGVFERRLPGDLAHWSGSMFRIYGLDPAAGPMVSEADHLALVHPEDREAHEARRTQMRADPAQTRFRFEFRIRRADTGEVRWLASRGEVVRDAAGQALLVRGINYDVTERRRAEERQLLLAREVDHRAKNALAVVQSIVGLTRDADPERFRAAVTGRIAAMARAHTLLAREGWGSAELRELVEAELAPYRGGPAERVTLEGPSVAIAPDAAQPLAMALHELATNAAKYGALSVPGGRVAISWTAVEGGGLALRWRETGGPALDGPPARKGFGSSVIRNTVGRQLRGAIEFGWPASGLDCSLTLPATHLRWPEGPARG